VDLTIDVSQQGDWTILVLAGELDLYTSPTVRSEVHAAAGADRRIALDLSDVTFIDSSGLGAIVGGLKHVRETGGDFAVIAPPAGSLTRMLTLTGLDQVVQPVGSRDELESNGR
jgi:anti-sigma B factor antagonist